LGEFKVICCQCGSDKVIERSARNQLDRIDERVKYGEGIQRMCLDCSNESFNIFKTWTE
jgi:hypothetical protein